MMFRVPEELYEQPLICCAECLNPVPHKLLDMAHAGILGPCPNCGSEKLMDNPYAALTYSAEQEYPGVVGLMNLGAIFDYFKFGKLIPTVNTQTRKRRIHPLMALITALGQQEESESESG